MEEQPVQTSSKGYQNDPIYFKSLIGKTVEVEMANNKLYKGLLYCIDPVTENIVLINKTDDKHYDTELLLGYCVKNINVTSDEVSNDPIFEFKTNATETEDMNMKREEIKQWLSKHYIEVVEDGADLKIGDDLVIYPPYSINNCISSNTIILERIHAILSKMKEFI